MGLLDFDAEYTTTTDIGFTVRITKMGGGTVGRAYSGVWLYIVTDANGTELGRGRDLVTGMPHTHEDVARIAAEFFESE